MTNTDAQPGRVYLVGAGPGDPSLLTLRAAHLLRTATVILYDGLVSPEILALASFPERSDPPRMEDVSKRCGAAGITQIGIHRLMIDAARSGASVLRLKSGDPLVFGRAGEEIAALREAGLPFEIVPGITAAFAAAATLQTPLTNRKSASKLIFATAHHAANKAELDPDPQPLWHGPLPADATLVIYMPGRHFRSLAAQLIGAGIHPETPVTAISRASTPHQHIHRATLEDLEDGAIGPAPVLLLIGEATKPI